MGWGGNYKSWRGASLSESRLVNIPAHSRLRTVGDDSNIMLD